MGEADAGIGMGERRAAWSQGLGELGAQESFNSGVDVPSCGNQGLQVGLPVDETHGVKLLQLLLESHFWRLHLKGDRSHDGGAGPEPQRCPPTGLVF